MSDASNYVPPVKWEWNTNSGGRFASINRPISGSTYEKELPRGKHPIQLYSLATPNGVKVTIMLEELLELGFSDAEYDAFIINIMEGSQFSSGFVEVNPNSKIPAMLDVSGEEPLRLFESGSMLLYLAERFNAFLPIELHAKTEVMNWLFWQMASTPFLGGGFGHFYAYAPEKLEYPIDRFTMEVKRQLDLLDKTLAKQDFIAGEQYTIADIAIYPWYGELVIGDLYNAQAFLDVQSYKNVVRWAKKIQSRPAVKRGSRVNKAWGPEALRVIERHDASDIS